jgi:hypothetical protein
MNLKISNLMKDFNQEFKENSSINNWIRVLNTSGMNVVDRLILDNHRRQILKNLTENEEDIENSYTRNTSKISQKSKPKPFSTFQAFKRSTLSDSKKSIPLKTLNDSFLTNESKGSMFADRLYNDAILRNYKIKKRQEEKEISELENAIDSANLHHPKRKLNPEVLNRLWQEDKIIKNFYDICPEGNLLSGDHQDRPRRFSSQEQKASVDRLTRTRDRSFIDSSKRINTKKLMPDELSSLVQRLYKVKKYPEPDLKKTVKKASVKTLRKNKDIEFQNNILGELKTSERYEIKDDKPLEVSRDSIIEFSANEISKSAVYIKNSPLKILSPKIHGNKMSIDEKLEVKLLNFDKLTGSPFVSVIRGSPEDIKDPDYDTLDLFSCTVKRSLSCGSFYDNSLKISMAVPDLIEENSFNSCLFDTGNKRSQIFNDKIEFSGIDYHRLDENTRENTFSKPNSDKSTEINEENGFSKLNYEKSIEIAEENRFCIDSNKLNESDVLQEDSKLNISDSNLKKTDKKPTNRPDICIKNLPIPKTIYLEPEILSSRGQSTTYSEESLYLMQNPLQTFTSITHSPKGNCSSTLDSYRFIIGISENDEFIYAD